MDAAAAPWGAACNMLSVVPSVEHCRWWWPGLGSAPGPGLPPTLHELLAGRPAGRARQHQWPSMLLTLCTLKPASAGRSVVDHPCLQNHVPHHRTPEVHWVSCRAQGQPHLGPPSRVCHGCRAHGHTPSGHRPPRRSPKASPEGSGEGPRGEPLVPALAPAPCLLPQPHHCCTGRRSRALAAAPCCPAAPSTTAPPAPP